MMRIGFSVSFFVLLCSIQLQAQVLSVEPKQLDFGKIEAAGSLRSHLVLRNNGTKEIVVLRAESPRGLDVFISSKRIPAGDTLHLRFVYVPRSAGKISEDIDLLHSGSNEPLRIHIQGEIKSLLSNDLASCVSFEPKEDAGGASLPVLCRHQVQFTDAMSGQLVPIATISYVSLSGKAQIDKQTQSGSMVNMVPIGNYAIVVNADGYEPLMIEEYIPLTGRVKNYQLSRSSSFQVPETPVAIEPELRLDEVKAPEPTPVTTPVVEELDERLFKPNNVLFLIDISGSMKDPDKLPLLKTALMTMLHPIRPIDQLSIVTYSDEARLLLPVTSGAEKAKVMAAIDSLQAGGITSGSKGVRMAYSLLLESYISGGNNQVILATDGAFRLGASDRNMIESSAKSKDQPILLTVVGFGEKKEALEMLSTLSELGGGSMLEVSKSSKAEQLLLEEIKKRSHK